MNNEKEPVIFLTGTTGFLGGAIIAYLAQTVIPCRLILLVRGESNEICLRRVHHSASRFVGSSCINKLLKNAVVITGDVVDNAWHGDKRLDSVTHVLHLAANTSFGDASEVYRTNVNGAISVATSMKNRPRLTRYLHVSTAMICGNKPPRIVYEDDYPRECVQHPVPYPSTKAEAEMLLGDFVEELPLVIVRPSIIVGHSQLGCIPSCEIYWCFRATHSLKRVTWEMGSRMDVIPVDYAASSLVTLLLKPSLYHSCYHISAGNNSGVVWNEICESFSNALGEVPGSYGLVDFKEITPQFIAKHFGSERARTIRRAIELYWRFARLDVVFDNARMLGEGILPPPKFTSYIHQCVETSEHQTIYDQMVGGK